MRAARQAQDGVVAAVRERLDFHLFPLILVTVPGADIRGRSVYAVVGGGVVEVKDLRRPERGVLGGFTRSRVSVGASRVGVMSEQLRAENRTVDPAVINCRIRALWASGELTVEGRAEYGRLLVAWEEAVRGEQQLAA
ncbi:hypothetical protein GCM10010363_54420 [Streptomyces omiyaensis]|nr:hypothetical protein GCM10010363_54420 [Streptomyces omiyaensis]